MAQAPAADAAARRPSPALSLNLSSNNPFRNRANSPALTSPASLPTPTIQSARPSSSRNPFLSAFESDAANKDSLDSLAAAATAHMATGDTATSSSPRKTAFDSSTKELFDNLTLADKPAQNGQPQVATGPKRSETLPMRGHRPNRSGDDGKPGPDGARRPSRPRGPPQDSDPFASPERRDRRDLNAPGPRPRRTNSESSRHGPLTEEEKRARDQRRRDRERRHRERGDKPRDGKSSRSRKPNGGLDLIDKLDVTGIYGPALFHHDGPFDACNPQRNRKKDTRAPMQAFPTNSKNNTIGGSGPLNKTFDMDRIRGTGAEAHEDFAAAPAGEVQSGRKYSWERERPGVYDPFTKVELQHGEETVGLGTSTFLEGTQASRSAMQRKESENDTSILQNVRRGPAVNVMSNGGDGLTRKRSLVQRIRGMSQPRRGGFEPGAPSAFNGAQEPTSPNGIPARKGSTSATVRQVYPASAGGRIGVGQSETNPFFNDYNDAYEKKGASIKLAEHGQTGLKDKPLPQLQPNSPTETTPLERRGTGDADADYMARNTSNGAVQPAPPAAGGIGGGFLSRVKSLKGRKGKA